MLQNHKFETGVTASMQNYFARISENVSILKGVYLNDENNEHFIANTKHLHAGDKEKMKRLNPGCHIGEIINDKVTNFIGEPNEEIEYNLTPVITSILATGYALVQKTVRKGKGRITDVDCTKYYFSGGKETIIEIYQVDDSTLGVNGVKYYLYVQQCEDSVLTNKLFHINSGNYTMGTPVPLETIPSLAGRPQEERIDFESIATRIWVEDSMVEKVKQIVYSLDRKLAEADKQYNRYTEQFKVFDNIEIPEGAYKTISYAGGTYKVVDFDKLGTTVLTDANLGAGDIKIIENTNKLLAESFDMYERQIKQVSVLTDIPLFYFGIDTSEGNDSGTSKTKSSEAFYKRVDRYRKILKRAITETQESLGIPVDDITFPTLVDNSEEEILANLLVKKELGITTPLMMIMETYKVTEEEANKILTQVNEYNESIQDTESTEDNSGNS